MRGCHTALQEIHHKWVGTKWFVEGDISRCFDSLDHQVLLSILGEKIHDNVVCDRATGSAIDDKVNEPGPIFLQGDHGSITFRNMRIKELPKDLK